MRSSARAARVRGLKREALLGVQSVRSVSNVVAPKKINVVVRPFVAGKRQRRGRLFFCLGLDETVGQAAV